MGSARDWKEWSEIFTPGEIDYYKAGMPCTNYATLGAKEGASGSKGGDLFLLQTETILALKPKTFRLEMVPSALDTNDGFEVMQVIESLSESYQIDARVIDCWEHGDPTSRSRLFIVGLRADIFKDLEFEWPKPNCNESWYPIARDIAIPDEEVPKAYWRYDSPGAFSKRKPKKWKTPKPGNLQHIGYAGTPEQKEKGEAGYSKLPFNIHGWDGVWGTQMTTNGGSRRPKLSWKPGDPLKPTRMTTPRETCRVARKGYSMALPIHQCTV